MPVREKIILDGDWNYLGFSLTSTAEDGVRCRTERESTARLWVDWLCEP